jgi:hypothetical protein
MTNETFLKYRIARYFLLGGTWFVAFKTAAALLGTGLLAGVVAFFFSFVIVYFIDGSAFTYAEKIARHITGQERMHNRIAIAIAAVLAFAGYAGTITFSYKSIPQISAAMVEDKGDTYKDMEGARKSADASFAALVAQADKDISRAQERLKTAEAKSATARRDGIKAQGGNFAKDALAGNAWVWTKDAPYHKQRAGVAAYEKQAAQEVDAARAELAAAQAAKRELLTTGRAQHYAGVDQVLSAGTATVKTWQARLMNNYEIVFILVVVAAVLSLLFLAMMTAERNVPHFRDIIDIVGDSLRLTFDAIISGLTALNRQAEKVGQFGIVPPGSFSPPAAVEPSEFLAPNPEMFSPPTDTGCAPGNCAPDDEKKKVMQGHKKQGHKTAEIMPRGIKYKEGYKGSPADKLRRKIATYKRLAAAGKLGEKGQKKLVAMQKEFTKIRGKK